jgi:tetratricopeptide (TPR) repeat protein
VTTLVLLALVTLLGRRDPAPELNLRALALARDPAQAEPAAALLRASLALNPDQEIAHFNLGWLLLVRDPAAAEKHFLAAAQLVPDKGGVYLGLGLARLNQHRPADAVRAFALEGLNDPAFLTSPWWREPAVAAQRGAARAEFARLAALAAALVPAGSGPARQLARVAALAPTLGEVPAGPERSFFRARTGYPVLMRNLDLPTPVDLYPVRESAAPAPAGRPAKGWLPSPVLRQLLDAPRP